jgi:hypothetical protein
MSRRRAKVAIRSLIVCIFPSSSAKAENQYSAPPEISCNALEYWMPPLSRGMTTFDIIGRIE